MIEQYKNMGLRLNVKRKVMAMGSADSFSADCKDMEVTKAFASLGGKKKKKINNDKGSQKYITDWHLAQLPRRTNKSPRG